MSAQDLREGGIDHGGSFVEYDVEGRREQGWVYRVLCGGELVQIETFCGTTARSTTSGAGRSGGC